MRVLALATLAALSIGGCKKTNSTPAAAAAEPAPAKSKLTVEMPDDPAARKLAEDLIAKGLKRLNPTGSSDFSMDFTFAGDGTWTATGEADLAGETLDCEENGTWKIDEMVEAKGRIEWAIEKTNCPNRNNGDTQRALVGFEGDEAKVSFR